MDKKQIEVDHNGMSDVYDILQAYGVDMYPVADAISLLLNLGRNGNTVIEDLQAARDCIDRAAEQWEPMPLEFHALKWFTGLMKNRLATSRHDGFEDSTICPDGNLIQGFTKNMQSAGTPADLADAANFLMMLSYRGSGSSVTELVQRLFKRKADEVFRFSMKPGSVYLRYEDGSVKEIAGAIVEMPDDAVVTLYPEGIGTLKPNTIYTTDENGVPHVAATSDKLTNVPLGELSAEGNNETD